MCATNHCGCAARTTFGDFLFAMLAAGLWKLTKVLAYLVAVAAVAAYRWFGGAPMWGTAAIPAGWPRWKVAAARSGITSVAVLGAVWPQATAAALAALAFLGAGVCLAVWESRRREAARRAARTPVAAIAATPHHALTVSDLFSEAQR